MHDFVDATASRRLDRAAVRETLQLHRELLRARELAAAGEGRAEPAEESADG